MSTRCFVKLLLLLQGVHAFRMIKKRGQTLSQLTHSASWPQPEVLASGTDEPAPGDKFVDFGGDNVMDIDGEPYKCCCSSNVVSEPDESSKVICEIVKGTEGCKQLKGPGFHSWNNMGWKYKSLLNYGHCAVEDVDANECMAYKNCEETEENNWCAKESVAAAEYCAPMGCCDHKTGACRCEACRNKYGSGNDGCSEYRTGLSSFPNEPYISGRKSCCRWCFSAKTCYDDNGDRCFQRDDLSEIEQQICRSK